MWQGFSLDVALWGGVYSRAVLTQVNMELIVCNRSILMVFIMKSAHLLNVTCPQYTLAMFLLFYMTMTAFFSCPTAF